MFYRTLFHLLCTYTKGDAEKAHELALWFLSNPYAPALLRILTGPAVQRPVTVCGIRFPNPVGLAAGFDKNAEAIPALSELFGFLTVGTVLPQRQMGNERPRVFRLTEDYALINRMGFNSHGVESVAKNLKAHRGVSVPIEISIGKMKETPNELAHNDYIRVMQRMWSYANFFGINISSPNTPGIRLIQKRETLEEFVKVVVSARNDIARFNRQYPKPVFFKVDPDMDDEVFETTVGILVDGKATGIIVGNTTLSRERLWSPQKSEAGGHSGPLLLPRTMSRIKMANRLAPNLPSIAVGGIWSSHDAALCLDSGASLVKIYTSFIYGGPNKPKQIARGL